MFDIIQLARDSPVQLVVAITIVVIILIMIGHAYREQIQQRLKGEIYTFPSFTMDWWSVSHFVLFCVYGLIIPNRHVLFFLIGAGWELTEDYLAANKNTRLVDCQADKSHFWCGGLQDDYWYGKWDDVIFNTFGYTLGSAIRTTFIE